MSQSRTLYMRFAGRIIDLLGHQMYGGSVPSVAELVANAWDADAEKVEITIPQDINSEDAEIIVRDYGRGMTFNELQEYYLNVGYERRQRGDTTEGGRAVMGRKGIGKLAGFGIAEDIVVTSIKDSNLIEFTLNYTKLKNVDAANNIEFILDRDETTTDSDGVQITFRNLKLSKQINPEQFRKSMARRFAISSEKMQIIINGVSVTKEAMVLEYRFPEQDWEETFIPGFGAIEYWFGFQKNTIKDSELRGVSIFARERVAQFTPFFFNLSGGINGQVALEYLTGQVKADALDESDDYIATDRQTVNWQFGKAVLLENWGKEKVKEWCKGWKDRHTKAKLDRFTKELGDFSDRINYLKTEQERKDLTEALKKIASIDRINQEDFNIIANSMISGVERESVKKVIKRINATSENALPEIFEAVKEWDIISAVSTAEIVYGRIQIIEQFKKHIDNRLPEKSPGNQLDMQKFIKDYPWLLGHRYEQLEPADFYHEKGLDKWIEEIILETNSREYSDTDKKDGRRFDLLCIKNDWLIVILELIRPGKPEDYDHLMRLNRYVTRVRSYLKDNVNISFKEKSVYGLLIADKPSSDPSLGETKLALKNNLESITWDGLFENVKSNYKEYYDLLKNKAPEDPRLKGLVNL